MSTSSVERKRNLGIADVIYAWYGNFCPVQGHVLIIIRAMTAQTVIDVRGYAVTLGSATFINQGPKLNFEIHTRAAIQNAV